MLTLLDTVINSRLEATRVLSTSSLQLEATGISTSACILAIAYMPELGAMNAINLEFLASKKRVENPSLVSTYFTT